LVNFSVKLDLPLDVRFSRKQSFSLIENRKIRTSDFGQKWLLSWSQPDIACGGKVPGSSKAIEQNKSEYAPSRTSSTAEIS